MPITQKPLRPMMVDYQCDECGKGYYRFGGKVLASYPPKFPHVCNNCGDKKTFKVTFPYIKHAEQGCLLDLNSLDT